MEPVSNQPPAEYVEESEGGSPLKKIILIFAALFVAILIIAGAILFILPRLANRSPGDATLTYWLLWEDPAPFQALADEFTKQNPNIKINIEKQDIKALGKYVDRLSTRISNGTGPDIFRYHNSWVFEIQSLLAPFPEDVVNTLGLNDKYYPVVAEDLNRNGAFYGVPLQFDSLALFVNQDLFANAGITTYPTTWDEVVTTARNLTVKDSEGNIVTAGIPLGTVDNISHSPDIVSLLLVQNGADLMDLDGNAKKSAIDALDFYTSFARGDAAVWSEDMQNSKLAFANGKVAMYIGYSWDIFEIKGLNPNLNFSTLPVPSLPGRSNTIASYWVEGVSSGSKYPDEAFEFLKFLASPESLEKLYSAQSKTRLFGELYPRSDMADRLKDNTLIYPFVVQGPNAVSTIFSSDTYDEAKVDALNVYLGNAVRSVLNSNGSADSAVTTLSQGVNQIFGIGQAEDE